MKFLFSFFSIYSKIPCNHLSPNQNIGIPVSLITFPKLRKKWSLLHEHSLIKNIFSTCVCQTKKCFKKWLLFLWVNVKSYSKCFLFLALYSTPEFPKISLFNVLTRKNDFHFKFELLFIHIQINRRKNLFITFICMESLLLKSRQQCSLIIVCISHYRTENHKKIIWWWRALKMTFFSIAFVRIINSQFFFEMMRNHHFCRIMMFNLSKHVYCSMSPEPWTVWDDKCSS